VTVATAVGVHRQVAQVMGMPISLALRGRHAGDEQGRRAWERVLESLRDADAVFSTYRADSVISRLNRGELDLASSPAEVHEVLALGERAREESRGAFDVRRRDAEGRLALDPSGVVKGWAVQRAAQFLEELAETDYTLAGGGDMVCRTAAPASPGWRVGIEDPHQPDRVVAVVPVRNGAVATSGSAHRGEHILDPRTGRSPSSLASITVVAPTLVWADIDATAAYVLGQDGIAWLTARGRSGVAVWSDGRSEIFGA
jgi:thiamine biosynthesis lipoprotein